VVKPERESISELAPEAAKPDTKFALVILRDEPLAESVRSATDTISKISPAAGVVIAVSDVIAKFGIYIKKPRLLSEVSSLLKYYITS